MAKDINEKDLLQFFRENPVYAEWAAEKEEAQRLREEKKRRAALLPGLRQELKTRAVELQAAVEAANEKWKAAVRAERAAMNELADARRYQNSVLYTIGQDIAGHENFLRKHADPLFIAELDRLYEAWQRRRGGNVTHTIMTDPLPHVESDFQEMADDLRAIEAEIQATRARILAGESA